MDRGGSSIHQSQLGKRRVVLPPSSVTSDPPWAARDRIFTSVSNVLEEYIIHPGCCFQPLRRHKSHRHPDFASSNLSRANRVPSPRIVVSFWPQGSNFRLIEILSSTIRGKSVQYRGKGEILVFPNFYRYCAKSYFVPLLYGKNS